MRILIVDDLEENRYFLETLLKGQGFEAISAKNGVEALEKLDKEKVDMIITDILMPEMDGFQLCRAVHKNPLLNTIPFVFYTATYTEANDEKFAMDLGADLFLKKPMPPEDVLEAIQGLLADGKTAKARSAFPRKSEEKEFFKPYSERLVKKLENKMLELEKEVKAHQRTENELRKKTADLEKRIKEIHCLYSLTALATRRDISLDEIFKGTLKIIPPAFQHHESTCVLIRYNSKVYQTENFKKTPASISEELKVFGETKGTITVGCLDKKPGSDKGIILDEEKSLLRELAERLKSITEQKLVEEALKLNEQRHSLAQKAANIGTWDWDVMTNDLYWSEQIEPMFGFSAGQFKKTYEGFLECVHPEDRQYVIDKVGDCLKKGINYDIEHRIIWPDKTIHWVSETGAVLSDKKGEPVRMLGTVRDITRRKTAEQENLDYHIKIQNSFRGTATALARTAEMRDPYTAGHQSRVTQLACAIAAEMHLSQDQIEGIRMAGLLHDIGKINIPAEILTKPTAITETEFSLIKQHPEIGYNILKEVDFPWPVAQILLQHHERMDGSGYPSGLKAKEILKETRIIMVSDVVEAMSYHRPYRPALGLEKALKEIETNSGVLYDAEVVDVCIKLFKEKKFRFTEEKDDSGI